MKGNNKLTIKGVFDDLLEMAKGIDLKLLILLLLLLNVKMAVKVIAIIVLYFLRPNFKFGFTIKNSRLPLFYIIAIAIALFNLIIDSLFTNINYDLVFITGISFWALSILAIHQIKLSIEKNDPSVIHRTLLIFFIINIIVSLTVYALIVWETRSFNPFEYQGEFQKYFISTGDYIKGVTFDTSTTNAIISALGVFYFLSRKNITYCLLCMLVLLLTGSNVTNLLFCVALIYTFIFQSTKDQKSILVICGMMLVIFLAKISPENKNYLSDTYNNYFKKDTTVVVKRISPDLIQANIILTQDAIKQKIAKDYLDSIHQLSQSKHRNKIIGNIDPVFVSQITGKPQIPVPNINLPPFQHKYDTTKMQVILLNYIKENKNSLPLSSSDTSLQHPGKLIAIEQTIHFLQRDPLKILTGNGIGNFSSKLSFRSTAMDLAGGYPKKFAYINKDFEINHFDLYLYFFSKTANVHSLANMPNSVYDQLLSEYGLLGLVSFFIFYIGFFTKHYKNLNYGIPILLIMIGVFLIDYWFEQLSVVLVFEVLLLLNIRETKSAPVTEQ